MTRAAIVFVALCFLTQTSFAQRDPDNSSYVDPDLGAVLKVQPLTVLSGYVMFGTELPIGKNRYIDFNVGVPDIGLRYNETGPGGLLVRGGVMLPLKHTSPYSIFYWMPQFNWGTYLIKNYTCYSCSPQRTAIEDYWAKQWAATIDFGYRHVNPATFFFYEIGVAGGYGGFNYDNNDFNYGQSAVGSPTSDRQGGYRSLMVTSHIALGFAFGRRNKY